MNTILVPLDGSALAEQALPYARLLATVLKAKIHLLRVIPEKQGTQLLAELTNESYPLIGPAETRLQREQRAWEMLIQAAQSYLADLALELKQSGLMVEIDVRPGDPAEQIVAVI